MLFHNANHPNARSGPTGAVCTPVAYLHPSLSVAPVGRYTNTNVKMEVGMSISSMFDVLSFAAQLRYNKRRGSVNGLSCDFILLSLLARALNIGTACTYKSQKAIDLFKLRYPLYPSPSVSFPVLTCDVMSVIVLICIHYQMYMLYPHTRSINQCLSGTLIFYLLVACVLYFVLAYYAHHHYATLNFLDCLDYVWSLKIIFSAFELMPQLSLQWFELKSAGLSRGYFNFTCSQVLFFAISKFIQAQSSAPLWNNIPINFCPWITLPLHFIAIGIMGYQHVAYSRMGLLPTAIKSKYERR
jgi:cystinosin